ncbi:MAG TPA: hypothetical protein VH352_02230, partial [Pseudonocardiaceae bacterium]|nr:hypothetical protein [Pseudonocardiaceae bacterium]
MNVDGSGRRRWRRRGLLFTVTPVVAAVLLAVAGVAVIVHARSTTEAGKARPTTFHASAHVTTPTTTLVTTTTPPPSPTPTTPPDNPALATAAVNAVDAMSTKSVLYGVAILDRKSGTVTTGAAGGTSFWAASVIKLFVITDILHRYETGAVTLSPAVETDIQRALELSDDNAMDNLWDEFGGSALIPESVQLFGLQGTLPPPVVGQWGEAKISAQDVLKVYQYILTNLTGADSGMVLNYLGQAADTGADGFNQAFGLLDPPRQSTVKAKQGWMWINGDSITLNTTGILGPSNDYVVAILS